MNRRKAPLLLALVLLLAGSALLVFKTRPAEGPSEVAPEAGAAQAPQRAAKGGKLAIPASLAAPREGTGEAAKPEDFISYLRTRYGARIREPHAQMRMLESLMRHFQQLNPSGWEADLLAALKQAFPEMYEELAARLRQRLDYEKWVKEHRDELQQKSD
ncbi:MAG TPA: hypothetical protein VF697_42320, partial [Archangium sp.]